MNHTLNRAVAKYIVSLCAVVALAVTPVAGSQLSGAELLARFDAIFASAAAGGYGFDEPAGADDTLIVIIEEVIIEEAVTDEAYGEEAASGETASDDAYEPDGDTEASPGGEEPAQGGTPGEGDSGVDEAAADEESAGAETAADPAPYQHGYAYHAPGSGEGILFEPAVPAVPGFEITSGISRRSESTFDSARTIVGTAPRGSTVRVEIFGFNEVTSSFYKVSGTVLTVGASGSFSSVQQLNLGRNFLRIKAVYTDELDDVRHISIDTAQLNRLADGVRNQLERGLLLP